MKKNNPIGVFDSGLGGLTVVKEIVKFLPHEDIIYLGDTARVPYGTRSKETVKKFSLEDANFLLKNKVKCIVIACNTSSALAGDFLKKKINIPVFDVIHPALKDALLVSTKNKIGVIGTRGTIRSNAYNVGYSQECPLFVPFIEEGEIRSKALKMVVRNYLSRLKGKIDVLILGCTHYPIIEKLITKEIGGKVLLINPGKSISAEVKKYLLKYGLENTQRKKGKIKYFVTDMTDGFAKIAETFLGNKISPKLKEITL